MTDRELLQAHARGESATAFAILVSRHVDLVYSAALRQARSPHLTEEIAQSVFVELHRSAAKIAPHQPLAAWLYVVARRTAIDAIRRESRRLARETAAAELAAMNTPPQAWSKVEASIDEAMETLNATERSAIVLRFFQNLSLREVGASLGISEDTAQKRVSRALDRLRIFYSDRGVAVTSAVLAIDLSAHAIQTAPAGLGPAISTAAAMSGAAGSAAVATASKAIAMTTTQKSLLVVTLILALGTGAYEATTFARQTSRIAGEEEKATALAAQLRRTREEEAIASARLKSVETQIDSRLASGLDDAALESKLRGWQANLDRLRDTLKQRPNLNIPELQLLSDDVWFDAATKAKLDSDDDVRRTLAGLRYRATSLMSDKMQIALNAYLEASDDILPDRIDQLLPFFNPPIDPAWLERYEILRTGKFSEVPTDYRSQIIGPKSLPDIEYDIGRTFGPIGSSGRTISLDDMVEEAWLAFGKANRRLGTAAELVPYLKWPASEAAVQKILDRRKAPAATTNPRPAANPPSRP